MIYAEPKDAVYLTVISRHYSVKQAKRGENAKPETRSTLNALQSVSGGFSERQRKDVELRSRHIYNR